MKLLTALALIGMTATPALAGGPATGSFHRHRGQTNIYTEEFCYEYVEEYIPGYYNKHGQYVGGYVKTDKKSVPCQTTPPIHRHRPTIIEEEHPNTGNVDDNSCVEGSILGGILGGGAGAAMSRGDGCWWAIPLGVVGGSMIGCQVDGG